MTEWLSLIKNAKYVISDSFHGTVFSIIFRKQFICLVTEDFNGNGRIPSLLKSLHINGRIVSSINDVSLGSFEEDIDYSVVEKYLNKERNRSFIFLKNALLKKPTYKNKYEPQIFENVINCFSKKDHRYEYCKQWIKLKILEMDNTLQKIQSDNIKKEKHCSRNFFVKSWLLFVAKKGINSKILSNINKMFTHKNTSFSKKDYLKYYMYRMLFKITKGQLKTKMKERRAYYRCIVKGDVKGYERLYGKLFKVK